MIDLIHLERLRQQRLRYEATQRQPATRMTIWAAAASEPCSDGRRTLLRVVSAVLLGWAVDGTIARGSVRRLRG